MNQAPARRVVERQCVSCRAMAPREALIRLVRTPEGEVILDLDHRRNGRGAYVCRDARCVAQATRRNAFQRALRRPVPEGLLDRVATVAAEGPGTTQ